ncbi:LysR family transcriptional regulator [Frondihabitans australicus]|uniref:DNA-binding transcriptional LysR family regulator n=1 Tax=Frondihabitans australicus TaxID=386892 RepID=A0A495IJ76_9MICO|nr:LysR family transcriptional regulator [Frondihabitans australicus]RKR75166.1 DNA-binding transcriptional LysR family regulator [Frondihabitans australicus]
MDNRQLEVFVAVAREGGFTRAAERLHTVQSAVSATILALETDLGERLFDRTTRTVRLTGAGAALLPHAETILAAFTAARDAVESVSGGLSGAIRIGYMTNVTLFDIPALLGTFSADHPGVTLHLAPASRGTGGLVDALRGGDLDVAFLSAAPEQYPDLDISVLASSPVGLVVAAGDPLARRDRILLAETAGLRFVDFREGFGNRTVIDAELARRGLRRDVPIETSDINDLAALARNGLGAAFLPRYLVDGDPTLHWITVSDAAFEMPVSVATSRERPLSAAAGRLALLARDAATPSPSPAPAGGPAGR